MKKHALTLISSMLLAAPMTYAQITTSAPYCTAGYDDHSFAIPHYISNVKLGTLDNTTGTTQFPAPHYAYYNIVTAPNLVKGTAYPLSVTHDVTAIHYVVVYIDYNHNNNFEDPGERVMQATSSTPNPTMSTVTIPTWAMTGTTRMRVMVFEDETYLFSGATDAVPCTSDATGSFDWGETEDYNVNIVSTAPIIPHAGFSCSATTGTVATVFTFTDTSSNTPTSWAWTFTPNNVTYQSGTTAASSNPQVKFTVPGNYTVKEVVTNAAGKDSTTKTSYIKITATTGIEEQLAGGNNRGIYPNPANDLIMFDKRFEGAAMTITDLKGRVVATEEFVKTHYNMAAIPAGIYVVRLVSKNEVYTQRLEIVR